MKSGSVIKSLLVSAVMLAVASTADAQSFEDFKKQAMSQYNAYKNKVEQDFKSYRDQVNAEFEEFMRKSWELKDGNPAKEKPKQEKDVPPVVAPVKDDNQIEDKQIPNVKVAPVPEPEPVPEPIVPIQEVKTPKAVWMDVNLYGTSCKVRFDKSSDRVFLSGVSENAVADMWSSLSGEKYDNLIADCLKIRNELALCDWAYMKLVNAVADQVYGSSNVKESVVLNSYLLTQSGFKIMMARSTDNSRLHMLFAADSDIFGHPYWKVNGEHYYLMDGSGAKSLYIFGEEFPKAKAMRLAMTGENRFAVKASTPRALKSKRYPDMTVSVAVNENLLSFYNDYPSSFEKGDRYTKWRAYAMVPLDKVTRDRLYPSLRNHIAGKSEEEAVNMILNFVQTAFVYGYDDEIWGGDRAFFSEETLFYPYCDCEDRSVLFSRLIRDLVGLDVVLLYYPGHLATAVGFNEDVAGDYLMVNGKKYVVCDPTYINARVGMTMPKMDNSSAIAVTL